MSAPSEPPVFEAPWQAQAFAMAVALHERGVLDWSEWADTLAACILDAQAAGDPDSDATYYRHWVDALEQLLQRKGLARAGQLHALEHAWHVAAERTRHGQPIELSSAERALARDGMS